jgi:alkylation response protein AidB-like acyl-CoA dehydrogenase
MPKSLHNILCQTQRSHSKRIYPPHAGQARRPVHGDERGQGLCLHRGTGLRPARRRARTPPAGLYGYINDYPTGRLLRDAKLYEIGVGAFEIRRMLIGRELFEETA